MQRIERKNLIKRSRFKPARGLANSRRDIFDSKWEAFVVKHDKATGKLIGKTVCCATAPVN